MPISSQTILDLAQAYLDAEQRAAPLDPLGARVPDLTPADAYRVQAQIWSLKTACGERPTGWKVGATNAAIQQFLGVPEPVFGRLFERNCVTNGGKVQLAELIHPRVECEIAFILATDLAGPGVKIIDVLNATRGVLASIEINDPRTRGWKIGPLEVIADNGLVARYVLGDRLLPVGGLDLAGLKVELRKNGTPAGTGSSSAVLGNPLNALAWLANALVPHGESLHAGMVVLPGSLTALVPAAPGDTFEAEFDQLGLVSVSFA